MICMLAATAMAAPTLLKDPWAAHDNLAVYLILKPVGNRHHGQYITLDEGLKSGQVVITEKGGGSGTPIIRNRDQRQTLQVQQGRQGAEVNTLWLVNKSKHKLLLLAGEMVVGGQQDRIIGKDALIPPGAEPVNLGVFCMEQSRWTPKSAQFAPNEVATLADPSVRGRAQHSKSQTAVWDEVAKKNEAGGLAGGGSYSRVTTSAAPKVRDGVEAYVKAIMAKLPGAGAAYGAVVAIDGKCIWVDRFESPALFQRYWPKLLRSYALDALASSSSKGTAHPSFEEAMRFANARDGKLSYEVQDGNSKLVKIESERHVIYELEDLVGRGGFVHASKMLKR